MRYCTFSIVIRPFPYLNGPITCTPSNFRHIYKEGVIRLTASYRHWREDRPVKVIVLVDDDETPQSPPLDANQRLAAILNVSRRCAAAPELDPRGVDEIIGYDPNGFPS